MDEEYTFFEEWCPVCQEDREFEESDYLGENYQVTCTYCYTIWPDVDSLSDEIQKVLSGVSKNVG